VTSRPWRGVLVGCGFFAPNHLHAWRSIPNVSIVAVCDIDIEKARALGLAFNISRIYDDVSRLLNEEEIDFVDVVTTARTHREIVARAARHKTAVICQKPFAESLEDADAMVSACREARVPLLVHENFRWQRPFLEMARILADGIIGEPQSLQLTFRHDYTSVYQNQYYLTFSTRLALMDVGVHLFDLTRVLLGEVQSLHCRTQQLNPHVTGEDRFLASCRHATGAVTSIDCSFFARGDENRFPQTLARVDGTRGKLELIEDYRLLEYGLDDSGKAHRREFRVEPVVPVWGSKPWHVIQDSVVNFQCHAIEVIEGKATARPSGEDNRKTLALVLAAYESAQRDEVINL
jgi:predicted dehydrogenase